jgi:nitronate monooxygenase
VDRILQKEKRLGDAIKFDDIAPEVVGIYRRIMKDGETDIGAWSCGMVAGLIQDIPTVRVLIDRIMTQADHILRTRLASMFEPVSA